MKLRDLSVPALSALAGLLLGYSSGNLSQVIPLSGGAILGGVVGQSFSKRKYSKQSQDCQDALKKALEGYQSVKDNNSKLSAELKRLQAELGEARTTIEELGKYKLEHFNALGLLQNRVNQLANQKANDDNEIDRLRLEITQWEQQFQSQVNSTATQKFTQARKQEIAKIHNEYAGITEEAMALFRKLSVLGEKFALSHQAKSQSLNQIVENYSENLDQVHAAIESERDNYLQQIEILRERISQLRRELGGELLEPVLEEFGFNEYGRIANSIATWLWLNKQIPLRVVGIEETGSTAAAGYHHSKSHNPYDVAKIIKQYSSDICKSLGIHSIESANYSEFCGALIIKFRKDRPQRKVDKSSLYRSQSEFIQYLLNQPIRFRIVGEPGAGKTPTVLVLMSELIKRGFLMGNTPTGKKLEHLKLAFCNPLAEVSVKNTDELDFCLDWNNAKSGFSGLADEYEFRKHSDNSEYKNQVGYVWICDEFDNAIESVGKEGGNTFKALLKDGGHINMGAIILGQSSMVSGTKSLSIDDQKMLTNIFIDAVSIRTFLTQYGDRFYGDKIIQTALNTLEQLELEAEESNETICDSARQFRFCMVASDRSPVFYQLPYFDSVNIDQDAYQLSLAEIDAIRKIKPLTASQNDGIHCPHCKHSKAKKNGKVAGKQRYQCLNPECKKNFYGE